MRRREETIKIYLYFFHMTISINGPNNMFILLKKRELWLKVSFSLNMWDKSQSTFNMQT